MADRKTRKPGGSSRKKPQSVRAVYARIKREFSAADLQKYTVIEEGIPAEQVLAEMEAIHRKVSARRKQG